MTVAITQEHNEARLAGTLSFLDAGTNPARLRIYGGTRPPNPAATPTSAMLVEIALTKPAGTIAGGLLTLTQQEDGLIAATGIATWARLSHHVAFTVLRFQQYLHAHVLREHIVGHQYHFDDRQ